MTGEPVEIAPPVTEAQAARRWARWVVITGVVLLAGGGLATYGVWWATGQALKQATADIGIAPTSAAPFGVANQEGGESPDPTDATAALAAAAMADHDLLASANQPSATQAGADWRPFAVALPEVNLGDAADEAAVASPAEAKPAKADPLMALTPETLAALKAAFKEAQAEHAASAPPARSDGSEQPAKPPETPVEAPTEAKPSDFQVSSVIVGPRGGMAIINGVPCKVGQTVGRGKVVGITAQEVEIEVGGQRLTIRM